MSTNLGVSYAQSQSGGRAPASKMGKVMGYLRAANEIRQTYQAHRSQNEQHDRPMPGDFPDLDIVRSGDEEMILFPSYAKPHVKRHSTRPDTQPGGSELDQALSSNGDLEYWKRQWEKLEDENAIVDVDVRGWMYVPQKGPLNRKNRLALAVARRLSGVPAVSDSPNISRDASPLHADRTEEAMAVREAEELARRGEHEADRAWRGAYSSTRSGSEPNSRSSSPMRSIRDATSDEEFDFRRSRLQRGNNTAGAGTGTGQAQMSHSELVKANDLLFARLRPFMSTPLINTTITVFFFNNEKSESKTVMTNESGIFSVRAALHFVPTQIRVLAGENLSATEEVRMIESRGISLISDIDDTVKHSAISSGAREMFKNTFAKDLRELTIKGVREWFTKMADMGVQMHYVSNSPWQLYPLLKTYFALAALPKGSFHLKQYSGMLQGIFEPAAERKKGSIEQIMSDFPDRKFILVGDSGEADLEVYADAVMAHPHQVLAIFIRDVTTLPQQGFFDQSMWQSDGDRAQQGDPRHGSQHSPAAVAAAVAATATAAPRALPPRKKSEPIKLVDPRPAADLIDLSDDACTLHTIDKGRKPTYADDLLQLDEPSKSSAPEPPSRPSKPSHLRATQIASQNSMNVDHRPDSEVAPGENYKKPPPPPKPRQFSKAVSVSSSSSSSPSPTPLPPRIVEHKASSTPALQPPPGSLARSSTSPLRSAGSLHSAAPDEGYMQSARRQLNSAYNVLPSLSPQSDDGLAPPPPPPPPAPRLSVSSLPAGVRRVPGANLSDSAGAGADGGSGGPQLNKKEEMWRRRWARAEEIMRQQGVVLKSWRVGSDVMAECVKLVEKEMQGSSDGLGSRGKSK